MSQVMLEEVGSELAQLVNQARSGEEVIITSGTTTFAVVVSVPTEVTKPIRPGYGDGKDDILYMADDFDAPVEDFKDYM